MSQPNRDQGVVKGPPVVAGQLKLGHQQQRSNSLGSLWDRSTESLKLQKSTVDLSPSLKSGYPLKM